MQTVYKTGSVDTYTGISMQICVLFITNALDRKMVAYS